MVGAYGEFSPQLHKLVREAVVKLIGKDLKDDVPGASIALSIVRRRLGVNAVRGQANLICEGVRWCGPAGAEAYANRKVAKGSQMYARDSAQAAWRRLIDGDGSESKQIQKAGLNARH